MKKALFYLALILIWEAVYRIGVETLGIWKSYIFPSPFAVLQTLGGLVQNGSLFIAIHTSMRRILAGYALSVAAGTALGLLTVRFPSAGSALRPLILGLQTLPSICWLPFSILWFGLGEGAILFVIAIGSTFAIAMTVESGVKNVNPLYIRAARTMGAGGLAIYRHVILPASLPSFLMGLGQGWSFAWRALMAGEMMSATKGLGQILMVGRDLADISQVMSVMLVIILIGIGVDQLVFSRLQRSMRHKWGLDRA